MVHRGARYIDEWNALLASMHSDAWFHIDHSQRQRVTGGGWLLQAGGDKCCCQNCRH